jgi:ATP-dependent DNA helicase RecG
MLQSVTTLRDPLSKLLGAKTAKVLEDVFGYRAAGDLLRHYPRRYFTRGELTDLARLKDGEHVTVLARVQTSKKVPMPGKYQRGGKLRERAEVEVTDGTASLLLTFFHKPGYFAGQLQPGMLGLFAGEVSTFRRKRQLVHPEYELLPETATQGRAAAELAAEFATELIPVYPASAKISSWVIGKAIGVILDTLDVTADPIPADIVERHGLLREAEALHAIHKPLSESDYAKARHRLKWDEAFVLQAALAQRRVAAAAMPATPRPPAAAGGIADAFARRLPFTLTQGQRQVGEVIERDLSCAYPMHRLLQGEVGSGKTVVAVLAMLQVVDNGGQAALLAPTEVLAQQHYRSISAMLGPLGAAGRLDAAEHATKVALLTGSVSTAVRRQAMLDAASGTAGIVIGTHALLEDRVQFADLGLVVIDEQHRFGVEQRDALREKANDARPHVLVMTATPIPRTVAMTVFGDLETSTLSELPAGRSPIATHVVPAADKPHFLERAWERVREEVGNGRQAYVVCPRIGADLTEFTEMEAQFEGSEAITEALDEYPRRPPLAVLDLLPELTDGPLHGLRVRTLHGRMPPDEKDEVMRAFAAASSSRQGIDVLVATTVIEVGVDVPNATVMVVMDAERFGVSQLHQLRGRVGRGSHPGLCLLVTESAAPPSRERLEAVAATNDGFELSRLDLVQRREGDVLGAAQAGRRSTLKLLRLLKDEELIVLARAEASSVVEADPKLVAHTELRQAIEGMLGQDRAEYLDKS